MYEKNHVYKSRKGWLRHTGFAVWAGVVLIFAGILSIIHAFIPNLFPYMSENMIKKLLSQSKHLS
jgi:hypothetical protein